MSKSSAASMRQSRLRWHPFTKDWHIDALFDVAINGTSRLRVFDRQGFVPARSGKIAWTAAYPREILAWPQRTVLGMRESSRFRQLRAIRQPHLRAIWPSHYQANIEHMTRTFTALALALSATSALAQDYNRQDLVRGLCQKDGCDEFRNPGCRPDPGD